ncbi:DDE-type integrase/transposase/recombinase [Novosphingobium sp. M1R2S20]|uniref:DDE-type integrase/transposase/recombinase n=1 Tax=Novosphingobium rhizovicinum TaxID=3228928 RepID=A0ABV3RAS8_9SPHN
MTELGNRDKQDVGRWANNRVENSHLPFRRRERATLKFRQMKTLQKSASVHADIHNHFSLRRHLIDRGPCELGRSPQRPRCIMWRAVGTWIAEGPPCGGLC